LAAVRLSSTPVKSGNYEERSDPTKFLDAKKSCKERRGGTTEEIRKRRKKDGV